VSFSVLVVPEDPTHNGYILRPLIGRILSECGKPNAKIDVLSSPGGKENENAKSLIENELLDRYLHMDLMLFCQMRMEKTNRGLSRPLRRAQQESG